jgi:hypothetical protein
MIIVNVKGGLGNQMFQYALYRALDSKDKKVKLDIHSYKNYGLHNGYELPEIFNIKDIYCTNEEMEKFSDHQNNIFLRIRKKLIGRKKSHVIQEGFSYMPSVFHKDNIYLDGYWQSEKFFIKSSQQIRYDFTFKKELDEKNKSFLLKIQNKNSVSIHIRRGDYITDKLLGNVCKIDYYKKAIEKMNKEVSNPLFVIFSDDIEWCKNNFNFINAEFVNWNKGMDSYKDMQLMSSCKHNVIANSSFSWWGAWLNNNKEKIVIAPSKWFNDENIDTKDVIPENWIKI